MANGGMWSLPTPMGTRRDVMYVRTINSDVYEYYNFIVTVLLLLDGF